MRLRKHAIAAVLMSTAVFTALAPQAITAPMPWKTNKTPTTTAHHVPSTAASDSGTVTVLCGAPCFE
ncbi:hypothetical protein [Streptomyces sp. NPDC048521]|uniref:hypothetical protein n=1 Tax=Streptomyces sp. NPDC048521 TaxID=3365566 RepID=UPI00371D969B